MIVYRTTFTAKRGRQQEIVDLVKKEDVADRERSGHTGAMRIYLSTIAPAWQMTIEWEYESLAEYEKVWTEWRAKATAEFWENWFELTEPGGSNEVWTLAE